MQIGIIITNSSPDNPAGEHSAEKLAAACAERLMNIDTSNMDGVRVLEARRLEIAIIEALVPHHEAVMTSTKQDLQANSAIHFARADLHHPGTKLAEAITAVEKAAAESSWAKEFQSPEARAHMHAVIGQFLVDTAHLERCYHADRNPDDPHAAAYKAAPTGIMVVNPAKE